MSWKDVVKEVGGADVFFLTEDGESITFVICGDPVPMKGKYQKQETLRLGVPIVSTDGFGIFIIGKRVFRRLAKYEKDFTKVAFVVVRNGAPGDQNATYDLAVCGDGQLTKDLFTRATTEFVLADLPEAMAAAKEIIEA